MTKKDEILNYCTEMAKKFELQPLQVSPVRSITMSEYRRKYKKIVKDLINKNQSHAHPTYHRK